MMEKEPPGISHYPPQLGASNLAPNMELQYKVSLPRNGLVYFSQADTWIFIALSCACYTEVSPVEFSQDKQQQCSVPKRLRICRNGL